MVSVMAAKQSVGQTIQPPNKQVLVAWEGVEEGDNEG